jgi:hypothetical protein
MEGSAVSSHSELDRQWLEAFENDVEEIAVAPTTTKGNGKDWRGVQWIRPVDGLCPKHGTAVGELTRLCVSCHQEQLEAARVGSNAWETPKK